MYCLVELINKSFCNSSLIWFYNTNIIGLQNKTNEMPIVFFHWTWNGIIMSDMKTKLSWLHKGQS